MGILQIFHPWFPEGLILRFPKINISGFVLVKTKWSQLFLNQRGLKRGFSPCFSRDRGTSKRDQLPFVMGKMTIIGARGAYNYSNFLETFYLTSQSGLVVGTHWAPGCFSSLIGLVQGKMTGDNHVEWKTHHPTISSQFFFDSRFAFVAISAFSFLGDSLAAIEVHRGWGFFFGPWSFSDVRFLTESVSLQQRH